MYAIIRIFYHDNKSRHSFETLPFRNNIAQKKVPWVKTNIWVSSVFVVCKCTFNEISSVSISKRFVTQGVKKQRNVDFPLASKRNIDGDGISWRISPAEEKEWRDKKRKRLHLSKRHKAKLHRSRHTRWQRISFITIQGKNGTERGK